MAIKNFSPHKLVKDSVANLKPNEATVVLGRFGIGSDHQTLSSIGRKLKLSRERIRQIEREGLRKMAREIVEKKNPVVLEIIAEFEKSGGITSHSKIAKRFLEQNHWESKDEFNSLHLVFSLMPQIIKIEKTTELEAGWILASMSKDEAVKVINDWAKHLDNLNKPATLDVLIDAHPDHKKFKVTFLSELPEISKKLITTDSGEIGLTAWPEINPRNVRDKIYFVLKQNGKPMHFGDIAKAISVQKFNNKNIVRATVHNELIADQRFVLIGRGIYALSEWGYQDGTVADIIKNVLDGHKEGLSVEEITKKVLKQRMVKKNTVVINLQTKPAFAKVAKDRYALK